MSDIHIHWDMQRTSITYLKLPNDREDMRTLTLCASLWDDLEAHLFDIFDMCDMCEVSFYRLPSHIGWDNASCEIQRGKLMIKFPDRESNTKLVTNALKTPSFITCYLTGVALMLVLPTGRSQHIAWPQNHPDRPFWPLPNHVIQPLPL